MAQTRFALMFGGCRSVRWQQPTYGKAMKEMYLEIMHRRQPVETKIRLKCFVWPLLRSMVLRESTFS